MNRVIVIGGGASGLMAAITAARNGAAVTILEAMEKPGKKILITGNGKCNLTNMDFSRTDIYRSEEPQKALQVLGQFDHQDTLRFFNSIGLLTHVKNNGVYPVTDQASSVTDLLIAEARRWKVKIKCREKVCKVCQKGTVWNIDTDSWTYEADKVILSCGSKSYPLTGSDGSGYELAERIGLQVIEPLPALVPLTIRENFSAKVSGLRSYAKVTLQIRQADNVIAEHTETGEVQWTDYGVSGIVIFQISRYAVKALREGNEPILQIDVLPGYDRTELLTFLKNRPKNGTLGEAMPGILPKKMSAVIIAKAGLKPDQKFDTIPETALSRLVTEIKQIILHVKGSKSFDMAQVCQGGISLDEVDLSTMEARRYPGLYVTGELLDADGICGGYNLQWAFSTGYIAGKASVKE